MSNSQSLDDLLNGGGGPPAFKFAKVGDTAKGIIMDGAMRPVTDIKTGAPLKYEDGNPRMQFVLTLRQDDGELVRVFCKPTAFNALKEARDKINAKFEKGGRVTIRYSGDEPSKSVGMSPKKLFTAQYEPPAAEIPVDDMLDE